MATNLVLNSGRQPATVKRQQREAEGPFLLRPRPLGWLVGTAATLEFLGQSLDAVEQGRRVSAIRWLAVAILVFAFAIVTETIKATGEG